MKTIIYIGDFKESYSTERYVKYALEELGYRVMAFQDDNLFIGSPNLFADDIESYRPEFVLFSKREIMGDVNGLVEELQKRNIKTITWLFDLFIGLSQKRELRVRRKTFPFNCQYVFSTDGGHQVEFQEYGVNHLVLRQGIHKPEAKMYKTSFKYPIIFVGGDAFGTREKMYQSLKKEFGSKFTIFGNTPNNIVRGLDLNKLFSQSKIVVGDSQPSYSYWSNRIYETLGRGGFLLHPKVEGLGNEFIDGVHYVSYEYGNNQDLINKINYYLINDKEREKIRKAGHKFVKNNYTYTDRCKDLLKMI